MKKILWILVLSCAIEDQIDLIRPGASYIIHSGDYAGIEWVDKSQIKPTPLEMDQSLNSCQAAATQKLSVTQQAVLDAKNQGKTTDERLNALVRAVLQ